VHGVGRNAAIGVLGVTAGADPTTGRGGVGVQGVAVDGLGFAGFFTGSVVVDFGSLQVTGSAFINQTLFASTIEAPSKTFLIDHPLDPANKYLIHSVSSLRT